MKKGPAGVESSWTRKEMMETEKPVSIYMISYMNVNRQAVKRTGI